VGYEWKPPAAGAPPPGLRYALDEVENLSVVDDNHLPYLPIKMSGGGPYSAEDIDEFIVSLPEKIYYPADAVEKIARTLFKLGGVVQLPPEDQTIIRYFITTASAFRKFVREHESEYDAKLVQAIMTLPFAQFLWIVEFSTKGEWDTKKVLARAVIDATAGLSEQYPFWLFHNRTTAMLFERRTVPNTTVQSFRMADLGLTAFARMTQGNVMRSTLTK
jgi:hypothetical protein